MEHIDKIVYFSIVGIIIYHYIKWAIKSNKQFKEEYNNLSDEERQKYDEDFYDSRQW